MPWSVTFAKVSLPLLAVAGFCGTLKFGSDNGLFKLIGGGIANKTISGTDIPLRTHWTGVSPVDSAIAGMISFFWPILDGSMPELSLSTLHFYGQFLSIWMLLYVESLRPGNSWKLVSFITVIGLLQENVALAFITPLYCLLHLFTSLTLRFTATPFHHKASLLAHPAELRILPWSILIGNLTPVALSLYCSPTTVSPFWKSRQFWIAARLFHPLYTGVLQPLLSYLSHYPEPLFTSAAQRDRAVFFNLQTVYAVARYIAVIPRIAFLTLVTLNRLVPTMFTEEYRRSFSIQSVYTLTPFWTSPRFTVGSVPQGSFIFLQYDELVTAISIVVWAVALNRHALSGTGKGSTVLMMAIKAVVVGLVGGPAWVAISLIEERDKIVLCEDIDGTEPEKKAN